MAAKKRGLGKGLDTLIPNKSDSAAYTAAKKADTAPEAPAGETIALLKLSQVEPNRNQPRKTFNQEGIDELAASIGEHGVITPILVQKEDDYYQIIAGERRWRAAKKAGLKEIPAIVKNYEGAEKLAVSLIENLQREDLDVVEEAQAYKRLIEDYGLTQEQVAKRVSKSRPAITNAMRLLDLDERVQAMLVSGEISPGAARAILSIKSKSGQYAMAQQAVNKKMSVREIEKAVRELTTGPKKKKRARRKEEDPYIRDLEEKMAEAVGTKVRIAEKSAGKGKIEIEYYSNDELDRLYEIIRHAGR